MDISHLAASMVDTEIFTGIKRICRHGVRLAEIEKNEKIEDGHIGVYACPPEDWCEYCDLTLYKADHDDAVSGLLIIVKAIQARNQLKSAITEEDISAIAKLAGFTGDKSEN